MIIQPKEVSVQKLHGFLLGAVAPRPIAFASTVDRDGRVNLSPFSFFNVFSSNPPVLIFSPARRVRDNSIKHTLINIQHVPQVCINLVSYSMVEQTSLASCEYPAGVNEFVKAGFSEEPSELIQPPRVAESPVSFECRVNDVIALGTQGGAGNLIVAEILLMRIKDEILDTQGRIDPHKLDAVARMGADYYCRASGAAVFEVAKPNEKLGVGVDRLPAHVWTSQILTGNDLGRLGNLHEIPDAAAMMSLQNLSEVITARKTGIPALHQLAKEWIQAGELTKAWALLALSPDA